MAVRGPGRGFQSADFNSLPQQRPLSDYPGEMVTFECSRAGCAKRARLRKQRLIAQYGPDVGLNTLLLIHRPKDCLHNRPDPSGSNPCRLRYGPELLASVDIGALMRRHGG